MTQTWARIDGGVVAELTDIDPTGRFHPSLTWVEATATPGVAVGWQYAGGTFSAPPVPAPSVADALASLAGLRYAKETAGVRFQAAGAAALSLFATDRQSQAQIAAAYAMARDGKWPATAPWKAADGTFVAMAAADVQTFAQAVAAYVQACFAREAALAPEVQANPATDITGGWPSQG